MKNNIGLIIISTGLYHQFIEPLLDSARKFFCIEDNVTFYLFTDSLKDFGEDVVSIPTKHEAWPGPTLHRYRNIINSKGLLSTTDYLFYCDCDMLFVDHVGREILGSGLTATYHPGFWAFGTGSWCNVVKSTAYTHNREKYYAGGFSGGKTSVFLAACNTMKLNIEFDEAAGVMAEWHDESHLNCLLSKTPCLALTPDYCAPEQPELRKKWRIDHLKPKIIALAKNHKEIRQ